MPEAKQGNAIMKTTKSAIALAAIVISLATQTFAAVTVTNVTCQQRYPWNGLVDIDYEIVSDQPDALFWVYPKGTDNWLGKRVIMNTLSGDGATNAVGVGKHRMVWDAKTDMPKYHTKDLQVTLQVIANAAKYLVVDVSTGPTAPFYNLRYSTEPPDLNDDTCRTDEIWLRLVLPGTFMMGDVKVILTKPYYMGIFEMTQKQWENVMGDNPARWKGGCRPVDTVSYNDIRGTELGAKWPSSHDVDTNSVMGILRAKTALIWDLPTEAQWEYACRAGTTSAFNNGGNSRADMALVGRFSDNRGDNIKGFSDGTVPVGNYLANNLGLYDMHGNVYEWCLDHYNAYIGTMQVTDPVGWTSGENIIRGGGFYQGYALCTSQARDHCPADSAIKEVWADVPRILGFRPVVLPFE